MDLMVCICGRIMSQFDNVCEVCEDRTFGSFAESEGEVESEGECDCGECETVIG